MRQVLGFRSCQTPLRGALWIGVIGGLILRYVHLGGQSLWVDEVITLRNSFVNEAVPFSRFLHVLQGPLVSFVMHFVAAATSREALLRLPFAVAGGLSVLAMYYLARSLADHWTALHIAFLASLSPMLLWYSQEIRGYSFVVAFSILMTYCFVKWITRPTARMAFLYGLCLFGGLISNLSASFVAAAHFLYLVFAPQGKRVMGRWLIAVFMVLLVFSPWVREIVVKVQPQKVLVAGSEPLLGGGPVSVWAVPYALYTYSVGYTLGPAVRDLQTRPEQALRANLHWIAIVLVLFATPAVVGIVRMARQNPNTLALVGLWLLVPMAVVLILAVMNVKVFSVRYALVSAPAYLTLVGFGLAGMSRSRWWPATAAVATIMVLSIHNYFSSPLYAKDDFRRVARAVRADRAVGDAVLGIYTAEPLDYYLGDSDSVQVFAADDIVSREAMEARCREVAGSASRVWLSLCREWAIDPAGTVKGWFDANMEFVSYQAFPGVRLYLYEKPGE